MKIKLSPPALQNGILFILSCSMVVMALKLNGLIASYESQPVQSNLDMLEEQQTGLRADLDKLNANELMPRALHQAEQVKLTQRLQSLEEQSVRQIDIQTLQQELKDLDAEVAQIKTDVSQLQKLTEARLISAPAALPQKPRLTQAKPVSPPFSVIGLEMRGGEAFLAISPKDSQQLNDVALLRAGDTRDGWQVSFLEAGKAHFIQPNGVSRSIDIR